MNDDGSAGTALLGLSGMRLLAVSEQEGELEQAVETTAATAWCAGCGVQARPHGRRQVRVRDLPIAEATDEPAVGQAAVAVRRAAVPDLDVVRAQRAHRAASGADPNGRVGRLAGWSAMTSLSGDAASILREESTSSAWAQLREDRYGRPCSPRARARARSSGQAGLPEVGVPLHEVLVDDCARKCPPVWELASPQAAGLT